MKKPEQKKKQSKPKVKKEDEWVGPVDPKYTNFKNYLDEHVPYKPVKNPKHVYTIEFRRALFSEELFDVYTRYEMAVHKKERDRERKERWNTQHTSIRKKTNSYFERNFFRSLDESVIQNVFPKTNRCSTTWEYHKEANVKAK